MEFMSITWDISIPTLMQIVIYLEDKNFLEDLKRFLSDN